MTVRRAGEVYDRRSITRWSLPAERSSVSGSTTSTATVTPTRSLTSRASACAAGSRRSGGQSERASTRTVNVSSRPARPRISWKWGDSPAVRTHQLLELRRKDVDAAKDDHVVAAPGHLLHAPERGAGGPRQQPGEIASAVADDRQRLLRQRREHQLADLSVGEHLAADRVDHLGIEMVLPDVQAVLGLDALLRDAGTHDLRESVDVDGVHVQCAASISARIASVHGSAPKMPMRSELRPRVNALTFELVDEGEHVRRRHHDDRGLEIADQLHLARRHATRDRDDRAAEPLRAVVRPEPAGEEAVAVGNVDDVARASTGRADGPRHEVRPGVEVVLCVADHRGAPGGAAGSVDAAHVRPRHGEHAERIVVAEIELGGQAEIARGRRASRSLRA